MSQQGLRFTLDVDGLTPTATAVVSFTLCQNLSTPFLLTVDIASDRSGLTAVSFLEKNATLTIWQGNTPQRYLHGIITGMETGENNGWQMNYTLTLSSPLWRCGLRQNFRIFQQQDIQAISTTLLTENGVTDWVPSFYEAHPPREFCVQYGETDLGFLTRLWAEEGIFFFDWFHPTGPDQKLVLCDDVAGVSTLGSLPFNPNSREVSTECISEFRYRAQVRPSSVENQDYTFKTPGWPGYFSHHAPNLNGQRTQYEIFDYPGRFKDEQHGQDFARYQAEGHRQDAETAACESNSPKLWPGKRFTLTGHPSLMLNREWQVTGSVLKGKQPQAQHGHQGEGTTLSNSLDVIPADRTWRASPLPKPSVDGPQSAIVTGPAGEEIFCDEHGRVRVRFHWDRYCSGNEDSSCWIRVSQAWAGAGFGNLAIPRVGQEVIVDFLNGDPDQPIIMGRTYHQDNRSPGSLPGTKTQMTIRSKTYKGGGFNELRFEDATGQEQVYIHAQKNMDTEVLNNRTTDVKVDHTETIGNNQSIAVGLGQTVTVGKENAGGHDQTLTVAHDRSITVRNDQTLKVKNDRMVSISHDDGLYVANNCKVTVDGKQEHTTTGDHISLVKGSHSLEVKGDLARKVAGALGVKARDAIVLESSSITLKVGSSFVVIHPGGVDIMGPKINLNSGGSPGTPVGTLQPGVLAALGDDESGRDIVYFPDGTKEEVTDQGEPEQYGQTARKVVNRKSEFAINGKEKNYTSEVILITSTIIEKHSTYEIGGDHSAVYFNIKNDSLGPYLFDPNGSYNPYKKLENGHGQRGSGFLFSGEFANLNDFIAYQENPQGESKDKLESEWFPYKVKMVSLPITDEEIVVLKNAAIALDDGDEEPGAFSCAEWSSKLLQHIEPDMDTYTLPNSLWAAVVEIRKRRLEEKDTAR